MKTAEEAKQIQDICDILRLQVEAAYNRMGSEVIVALVYNNETEVITVNITDISGHTAQFRVNVHMDSVMVSISELIRELIIHIVKEFTGE